MNAPHSPARVAGQLRVGAGFAADERPGIVEQLNSLDARLATHPAAETDMELSVKDRDRSGQRLTLECWIAGRSRLVATSEHRQLSTALMEVRDDLRRQLNDAKTRTEPRNNRHLRT
jgi:ribosome-associated translation inhibitor RaiA